MVPKEENRVVQQPMASPPIRVDILSDLVCPWCYIGKRRFETALAAFPQPERFEIVHRAFQLDPTVPKGQLLRHRDVLMRKYGMSEAQVAASQARLERLAAEEGLEYHLAQSRTGNTLDAHRLVHLAGEHGTQDAVIERFYRAHFTEGRSLFDDESLSRLAEEAGLEGAAEVLATDRFMAEVQADHREANRLGANGVPFFVFDNRYAVSGAQAADVFAEALRRAADHGEEKPG
jgi:predicted DsbA family dithiol-disulfide isomerase